MLTPFEAVRIRVVENPAYAAGPLGALRRYVDEGGGVGVLYAGLLPLMVCSLIPTETMTAPCGLCKSRATAIHGIEIVCMRPQARQVSFGMIKFLVFDFAKEILFGMLPPGSSEDVRLTLAISLLSGAVAGIAASVVSQPADVLLSKVSGLSMLGWWVSWCVFNCVRVSLQGWLKRRGCMLLGSASSQTYTAIFLSQVAQSEVEGSQLEQLMYAAKILWGELGLRGFFLGLGSRCVFAAVIIAGQFFLYDAFREALKVTASDLTVFYDALGAVLVSSQLISWN